MRITWGRVRGEACWHESMTAPMGTRIEIKRVGQSGQVSLGKQHTGQYFREEERDDGSILLVPVVVVPRSHWSVRDEGKIRKALAWATKTPLRGLSPQIHHDSAYEE